MDELVAANPTKTIRRINGHFFSNQFTLFNKILCAIYPTKVFPYGYFLFYFTFSFTSIPIPASYFRNILFQLSPLLIFKPWYLVSA